MWRQKLSEVLMGAAMVGTGAVVLQRVMLGAHLSGMGRGASSYNGVAPARRQGISILKPLSGIDDGLAENLEIYASLGYAPYELLLGVKSKDDPAYSLARHIAKKYPQVARVVVQKGAPGLNPKVNQLASLEKKARFSILLISDSNTRPPAGYLDEMSAMFEDPQVGVASNPVAGMGHQNFGAAMDNLFATQCAAQAIAGHNLLGQGVVIGKSQAIRRDVLKRLGGFERYANFLAEDFLIGRDVQQQGYKLVYGRLPVFQVTEKKGVEDFAGRAARWSTMQATAPGSALPAAALTLLNPIPLALGALALSPSWAAAKTAAMVTAAKVACDMSAAAALGVRPLGLMEAAAIPVKDVVSFGAHAYGLVSRTITWRGNQLHVGDETRLTTSGSVLPQPQPNAEPAPAPALLPEAVPAQAIGGSEGRAESSVGPASGDSGAGTRLGSARGQGQRARFRSRSTGQAAGRFGVR